MWKRFIHCCDNPAVRGAHGFTLIELVVSSTIGLMILGMAVESANSLRYMYRHDIVRTKLNQDLRSSLDYIGTNIRQAGESLSVNFPAIEVVGGGTGPDELVLRKNLLDEVLNLCSDITSATANPNLIIFANGSATAGCAYSGNTTNYNSWRNYRLADSDQQVKAYLYSIAARAGDFFNYASETNTGTQYSVTRSGGSWSRNYIHGTSAVYMLEEWRFRLSGDTLQLIVNGDATNVLNVAFGLTDFQVSITLQDGTTRTSFANTDDWTQIESISVTLDSAGTYAGQPISSSLTSRFFPRNILSN